VVKSTGGTPIRETTGTALTTGKGRAFSAKARVDHSVFGLGTIVTIDRHRTTIAFDQTGTRTFVTSLVELEPSDTPAPARRSRPRAKSKKKVASPG